MADLKQAPSVRTATGGVEHQWRSVVAWVDAVVVAYLLVTSAIAHLGNPYQFVAAVRAYQLIPLMPNTFAVVVAMVLPFLHIEIALCLIVRRLQRLAFGVGFVLFVLYAIVQTTAWARGLKVGCGCFGPSEDLIGLWSIGLAVLSSLVCLCSYWVSITTNCMLQPLAAQGQMHAGKQECEL